MPNAAMSPNLPAGFDFTDPDVYARRLPVAELAEMRRVAPIWWVRQSLGEGGFGDGGYWVVSKHKDVKEVSRRSDVFSSLQKTALPRYADGTVDTHLETRSPRFNERRCRTPSLPACRSRRGSAS